MSFNAGREFGTVASVFIVAGLITAYFAGIWPLIGVTVALCCLSGFFNHLGGSGSGGGGGGGGGGGEVRMARQNYRSPGRYYNRRR